MERKEKGGFRRRKRGPFYLGRLYQKKGKVGRGPVCQEGRRRSVFTRDREMAARTSIGGGERELISFKPQGGKEKRAALPKETRDKQATRVGFGIQKERLTH